MHCASARGGGAPPGWPDRYQHQPTDRCLALSLSWCVHSCSRDTPTAHAADCMLMCTVSGQTSAARLYNSQGAARVGGAASEPCFLDDTNLRYGPAAPQHEDHRVLLDRPATARGPTQVTNRPPGHLKTAFLLRQTAQPCGSGQCLCARRTQAYNLQVSTAKYAPWTAAAAAASVARVTRQRLPAAPARSAHRGATHDDMPCCCDRHPMGPSKPPDRGAGAPVGAAGGSSSCCCPC
jgi:hypothetical protein